LFLIFLVPVGVNSPRLIRFREEMLMVFEHFAKWSFGFIYVILAIMAIFSFSFQRTDNMLVQFSFQIHTGFAMYLVALFTSYVVSYLILVVHRKSVLIVARKDLEDSAKVSISNIFFMKRFKVGGPLTVFIVFMLSFILILFGINFTGFIENYAGTLTLITQNQLLPRTYTLFGLTTTFVSPTAVTLPIIHSIMALYYIIGIALPVIHVLFLAMVWFVPLPISSQGIAFSITEIMAAWSSLEVFIISFLALAPSLNVVAGLVTGNACVNLPGLAVPQAQCLTINSTLSPGIFLSLIGAIFYVIAANIITRVGIYVIRFRVRGGIETERRKVAPDDSFGSDPEYGTPPEESYESAQSYSFGNSRSSRMYR